MKDRAHLFLVLLAIKPDYTNTVIPPNIAPLNFVISVPSDG